MKLSQERYWQLLLHRSEGESEIDDPRFFLAKEGKTDAEAELQSTIAALYHETRTDDNATRCKFPARTHWLEEKLGLEGLPKAECAEFDKILKQLDPQSASYIFPAGHVNSPASMFGHTFIRIDSSYDSKMLSHAINYTASADPEKENGFVFIIKGLMGGYVGVYSMLPYYEKIKEYRDSEQRDMWEYDLNLSRDEILAMLRHVWEVGQVYSDYFFFDENCSYNMLWLLEVARPTAHLREHFLYQVSPTETIFAVEAESLVAKKVYRPSKRTQIQRYEQEFTTPEKALVVKLAQGKSDPKALIESDTYEKNQKQYMLEAAVELAEYHYMSHKIDQAAYLEVTHKLRKSRALLGQNKALFIPTPHNPDQAHRSVRLTLQNETNHNQNRQLLGLRPTYHDFKDSDIGFLKGTGIEYFNTLVSYEKNRDEIKLEDFTFVSITSLAPASYFIKPIAWRINIGWNRSYLDNRLSFNFLGATGASVPFSFGYGYVLFEPMIIDSDETAYGLGTTIGSVIYSGDLFKMNMELSRHFFSDGREQDIATITQNWRLSQNNALQLEYEYRERFYKDDSRFKVILNTFF